MGTGIHSNVNTNCFFACRALIPSDMAFRCASLYFRPFLVFDIFNLVASLCFFPFCPMDMFFLTSGPCFFPRSALEIFSTVSLLGFLPLLDFDIASLSASDITLGYFRLVSIIFCRVSLLMPLFFAASRILFLCSSVLFTPLQLDASAQRLYPTLWSVEFVRSIQYCSLRMQFSGSHSSMISNLNASEPCLFHANCRYGLQ